MIKVAPVARRNPWELWDGRVTISTGAVVLPAPAARRDPLLVRMLREADRTPKSSEVLEKTGQYLQSRAGVDEDPDEDLRASTPRGPAGVLRLIARAITRACCTSSARCSFMGPQKLKTHKGLRGFVTRKATTRRVARVLTHEYAQVFTKSRGSTVLVL